jgi:lipopolysaccharide/colanic/teichoic acid biosynthesis glycosyltransferase
VSVRGWWGFRVKTIVPLVIDSQIQCAGASLPASLLTMPLGKGSVLGRLADQLSRLGGGELWVMPSFTPSDDYERRIRVSTHLPVRVVHSHQLPAVLVTLESADILLVMDPRYWPANGHDAAMLAASVEEYHGATHLITVQAESEDVRERIECDSTGSVQRIQRLYSEVEWPETAGKAIVYTLAPARSVAGVSFRSLSELRAGLLAKGGLNRDLPLDASILDLSTPRGLLLLSDRILEEMNPEQADGRFTVLSPGVLMGPNCDIDASVRFVPPVVIQDGTVIGESTLVIGPSLLGAGCRLGSNVTLAQCLVTHDTSIASGTTLRHQVCGGRVSDVVVETESLPDTTSMTSLPSELQWVREVEVLADQANHIRRRGQLVAKRILDLALALPALVVLAIPMLLAAIAVKLDSAGPVFFAHRREGRDGKEFPCLKFRTMSADAHKLQRQLYQNNEVDGPQFKLKQDPRVTRVGRLLRAANFDEIPQLFNVLLGHMSLVGPRPSPFRENQICVPWRRARLSVRPGITGLWQVCRDENRTEGDFHEWIFYDINYVRHFSFWLDLKILLATIVTLGGKWSVPLAYLVPVANQPHAARLAGDSH